MSGPWATSTPGSRAGYYYHTTLFLTQPLVMHYDGAAWTQVELPLFEEGSCELRGLTATGPNDILAAGTYADASGLPRPFLLRFDGAQWNEVTLPPTGGSGEWFRGMAAVPGGDVWAVGQFFDGSTTEPVTFRRRDVGVTLSLTPLVTRVRPGELLEFEVAIQNDSGESRAFDGSSKRLDLAPLFGRAAGGKGGTLLAARSVGPRCRKLGISVLPPPLRGDLERRGRSRCLQEPQVHPTPKEER